MKILIAEDSPTAKAILEKYLKEWGYEVVAAANGLEAWDHLQVETPPKIALLDWIMPGMNGIELCRQLKAYEGVPYTYIVLLTGKSGKESKIEGLEAGADDFLTKPYDPDELKSRLAVAERIIHYDLALSQKNHDLEARNRELNELNQFKNKLLGMVAHDLRNPLISIRGISELCMRDLFGPLNPEQKENVQSILETSQQMLNLVNELLDTAVIESGTFELKLERGSLKDVIENRVKIQKVVAQSKNIQLLFIASQVPPFLFDAGRIAQVVDNLISNAIKFSKPGTCVKILLEKEGPCAVVKVQDQGPGITEEDRKKLFGDFQKLSNRPTGGEKSTGLGLAIVKRVIEAHQGVLEVDSRPGEGSTFAFKLEIKGETP